MVAGPLANPPAAADPTTAASSSSPSCGQYGPLSRALLHNIAALSLDAQPGSPGSPPLLGSLPAGSAADHTGSGAAAARFTPDARRGRLRLLQALKDPGLLKLVWSADSSGGPGGDGSRGSGGPSGEGTAAAAFDMFPGSGGGASISSGVGGGSLGSSGLRPGSSAELLGYLRPSAVAAAAARGPLSYAGCEHWEAAASHDLEVVLLAGATTLEAVELPNGSQVLVAVVLQGGGTSSSSRRPQHLGFWLQQRWHGSCLQAPARSGHGAPAGSIGEHSSRVRDAGSRQAVAPDSPRPPAAALQVAAAAVEAAGAAALAAALRRLLACPPAVDVQQLRKDVRDGHIVVRGAWCVGGML